MIKLGNQYRNALEKIKEQLKTVAVFTCKDCGTPLVKEEEIFGNVALHTCPKCGKVVYVNNCE